MAKLDLGQAEFLFHSDALADAVLQVFRFTGREALSQPFEFSIELASDDPDLDLLAPIGQPAECGSSPRDVLLLCTRRVS